MSMQPFVWVDGRITSIDATQVAPFHQGINYGACVYEGIRMYHTAHGESAIFRLDDHLKRLLYSARTLRMDLALDAEGLERAIWEVVQANNMTSGYIRPIVFFAEPRMGINIEHAKVSIMILCWDWDESAVSTPATLKIATGRHLAPCQVDLRAKIAGYYATGLLGFIEAREAGYKLPLLLDLNENVAESAISNIFFVKQGVVYTPKSDNILPGITRDTVMVLARECGIPVHECDIAAERIHEYEAAFLTGTGIGVLAVTRIDDVNFSAQNETLIRLQQLVEDSTHGRLTSHRAWLTGRGDSRH